MKVRIAREALDVVYIKLDDFLEEIAAFKAKHPTATRFIIDIETYQDGSEVYIYAYREETPDEVLQRINKDVIQREKEKEYRKKQYEQLKKEFGGT